MIAPDTPRELTPDELADAEALADRLYAGTAIRRPETLRAAYMLKMLLSDPRIRRES